jgi:hypothetical protein
MQARLAECDIVLLSTVAPGRDQSKQVPWIICRKERTANFKIAENPETYEDLLL